MKKFIILFVASLIMITDAHGIVDDGVRIKELVRVLGVRDNSLVGYGIVTGLAGTGDSARSKATIRSITNVLLKLGVKVDPSQINSRNVAAVLVIATLPAFSRSGDKLDVNITSIGDSRSLVGGALMLTHLTAANGEIYALAQGPVSVGGFKYDINGNVIQKNHPTAGIIPDGATVEREVESVIQKQDGGIDLKLNSPDFTTAARIVASLNQVFGGNIAHAIDAGRIKVSIPASMQEDLVGFIMRLESIKINPGYKARIVVNERTGTVVSGGDVRISKVTISHGDLRVSIITDFLVSQPFLVRQTGEGVRTQVVPDTKININEELPINISFPDQTTVADLVAALHKVKTSSRDIITILQAVKRAGALHAELIVQ